MLPVILYSRVAVFFHFMLEGYFNALWSIYLPLQQLELGLSDSLIGAASLFNYGGQVASTMAAAYLLPRIGARKSTLTGAILFCTSMFFIPLSHSFPQLCVSFLYFGMTEGVMDVSMNASAVLTESVARRPLLGTYHGSYSVAAAIGGLLGGVYVDQGFQQLTTYYISAAVGMVLACISFSHLYTFEQEKQLTALEETKVEVAGGGMQYHSVANVTVDPGQSDEDQSSPRLLVPIEHAQRDPLLALACVGFLASFGESAVVTWVTIWFQRNFSEAPGGLYSLGFTSFMICMALGRFCCDVLREVVGRRRIIQYAGILASGGVALFVLSPTLLEEPFSVYLACLGCCITGLGLSTLIPTVFSSAGHLPNVHPGTAISRVAFWTYAGSIISPPLIGFLSDAFESLRLGFVVLALLLLLISPLGLKVPPEENLPPPLHASPQEDSNLSSPLLSVAPL